MKKYKLASKKGIEETKKLFKEIWLKNELPNDDKMILNALIDTMVYFAKIPGDTEKETYKNILRCKDENKWERDDCDIVDINMIKHGKNGIPLNIINKYKMNKDELYIEIIKNLLGYLEEKFRKNKDKYRCWAIMSIRDVFSYTDPRDFTPEQLTKLMDILKDILLSEEVEKNDVGDITEKILKMGLTMLPVTNYAKEKFGE